MSTSLGPAALVLAELTLFWAVALLHMLRLLFLMHVPLADHIEDAAHMTMGAGMTLMVFPGVLVGILRASTVVFAVLAAAFFIRALGNRAGHRGQNAAIGAGQSAMAYMFAAPAHPPAWLPAAMAGVLALCALVHGQRLVGARSRTAAPGRSRMLVTLPHAGTVVVTATMAWMVVAA